MIDVLPSGEGAQADREFQLVIDGVPVVENGIQIGIGAFQGWPFSITAEDARSRSILYPLQISEFASLANIHTSFPERRSSLSLNIDIFPESAHQDTATLTLWAEVMFPQWKAPWSPQEFLTTLADVVAKSHIPGIAFHLTQQEYLDGFYFDLPASGPRAVIREEVERVLAVFDSLCRETESFLRERLHSSSLTAYFRFPEEIRTPCEQYLLYFVEFLRDVGVEAEANLEHHAGQVLFEVSPADGGEALERVRLALEVYLRLPASTRTEVALIDNTSVRLQQLAANIQHLRGQLALASAMLQLKDATIEQQQLTIEQQRRFLSGEIVQDSLQRSSDKEELLGGAVALIPYEGKGFEINLPEIYRRLRLLFSEKHKS